MKFRLASDESDEDRISRILDSKELKDLVTNDTVHEACLDFYPGKRIEINLHPSDISQKVSTEDILTLVLDENGRVVVVNFDYVEIGVVASVDQIVFNRLLRGGTRIQVSIVEVLADSQQVAIAKPIQVSFSFRDDPLRRSNNWISETNLQLLYDRGLEDRYFFYALILCSEQWQIVYRVAELLYKKVYCWQPSSPYSKLNPQSTKVTLLGQRIRTCLQHLLPQIKMRADNGNPNAMNAMGEIYSMGLCGVQKNSTLAKEYLLRASNSGWSEATYSVGLIEHNGSFVLRAAKNGEAEAQYKVSKAYRSYKGDLGLPSDYEEGSKWLLKSANAGYVRAQIEAGKYWQRQIVYSSGYDYQKSFQIYHELAQLGVDDAFEPLGFAYEHGLGVEVCHAKANLWYDLAILYSNATREGAQQGRKRMAEYTPFCLQGSRTLLDKLELAKNISDMSEKNALNLYEQYRIKEFLLTAQHNLSSWKVFCRFAEVFTDTHWSELVNHYDLNHPQKYIDQEQHATLQLLLQDVQDELHVSFERGDVEAQFWVGWLRLRNFDIPFSTNKNPSELIVEAALVGNIRAIEFLGQCSLPNFEQQEGFRGKKYFLLKAVELGSVRGMLHLRRCIQLPDSFKDYGFTKDYPRMFNIYLQAANLGCVEAMYEVGEELLFGRITGVTDDRFDRLKPEPEEGLKWIRKAAELGNGEAIYRLGKLYSDGTYVNRDVNLALDYFNAVKELKYHRVVHFTEDLKRKGLDDVITFQGVCPYNWVDDAIKELKNSLPKLQAIIMSSNPSPASKSKVLCPSCHRLLSYDGTLEYGERVKCDSCGLEFLYYVDKADMGAKLSNVALWQQGLIETINWPSSEFGEADFWLTDLAAGMLNSQYFLDEEGMSKAIAKKSDEFNSQHDHTKRVLAIASITIPGSKTARYYEWDSEQYDYLKQTAITPSSIRISKDFALWLGQEFGYQWYYEDSSDVYFFNQDVRKAIGDEACYEFLDAVKQGRIEEVFQELDKKLSNQWKFWAKHLVVMTHYWAGPDTELFVWSARDCNFKLRFPGDMVEASRYYGDEFNPGPHPIIIPKAIAYLLMNYSCGTIARQKLPQHKNSNQGNHFSLQRTSNNQCVGIHVLTIPNDLNLNAIKQFVPSGAMYHMVSIRNLNSILAQGILAKHIVEQNCIAIDDISDKGIQSNLRESKVVFDGFTLHDYASFYINPRNAMLYRVCRERGDASIVIIEVSIDALKHAAFAFSNMNAAVSCDKGQFFVKDIQGIEAFDWQKIHANSWVSYDESGEAIRDGDIERKMQAEILVLNGVPPEFIKCVHCVDCNVAKRVSTILRQSNLTDVKVSVSPNKFFERHHDSYMSRERRNYHVY